VSLDRSVFAHGQAYVAMSRVRTLEGLKLVNFQPSVIRAHPKVDTFYASLTTAAAAAVAVAVAVATSSQHKQPASATNYDAE
jgi:ATP-dependent exoDNAse (exonuclease V) alpha subunit